MLLIYPQIRTLESSEYINNIFKVLQSGFVFFFGFLWKLLEIVGNDWIFLEIMLLFNHQRGQKYVTITNRN